MTRILAMILLQVSFYSDLSNTDDEKANSRETDELAFLMEINREAQAVR